PLYLGASSNAVTRTGLHALALHDALPISSSVTALNQAFARRSGALQNCFQKNTEGLSGSPQVTIKFRVGTAGNVESASLQPEARSEEHTSELQSRENLVCRLLLEKKNRLQ